MLSSALYIYSRQRHSIATFAFPLTPLESILPFKLIPLELLQEVMQLLQTHQLAQSKRENPVYRAKINLYPPRMVKYLIYIQVYAYIFQSISELQLPFRHKIMILFSLLQKAYQLQKLLSMVVAGTVTPSLWFMSLRQLLLTEKKTAIHSEHFLVSCFYLPCTERLQSSTWRIPSRCRSYGLSSFSSLICWHYQTFLVLAPNFLTLELPRPKILKDVPRA